MFTASQDASSNIPRFPCHLGPGEVGEIRWESHQYVLQGAGQDGNSGLKCPHLPPGLALVAHPAILRLSSPAESPLWEGLAWGLRTGGGVGGGVYLTSKNLLQIRENMKELDFGFQGLLDLGALGWGAIWW